MVARDDPARWYLTPMGRIVRAGLGIPFLLGGVYLIVMGGTAASVLGVLMLGPGLSLPAAAVVQEPE